jgi:hypothetical protein
VLRWFTHKWAESMVRVSQGTILKVLPVDVRVESTFELNMLTGRAMVHKCAVRFVML